MMYRKIQAVETVRRAAQLYRENNCDAIIAVGGGSVIDTSKATNILVSEGGDDLLKYSGAHNLPKPTEAFFCDSNHFRHRFRSHHGCGGIRYRKECQNAIRILLPDAACSHFRPAHDPNFATTFNSNDGYGCHDPCH